MNKTLRNPETHKLTESGQNDLMDNLSKIQELYDHWRNEGYSMEEVFYMICTAAHTCTLNEAIRSSSKGPRFLNLEINA